MKAVFRYLLFCFSVLPIWVSAQPQFIDVTQAAQLEFTVEYGDEFASLTHPDPVREQRLQMLLRNLGNGAAVGDFDNDGDLDVYLLGQLGRSNRLYRNDLETGNKTFTDVTVAPLDDLGMSRLAHFADLDNDGFLDLVLVNDDEGSGDYPASKLFRNDGGTGFTDVTPGSGFEPFGYPHLGASLADFDGDGLLDIYLTVWNNGIFPGTNQLFRNLGDFRFEEVTAASGLAGLDRRSMTPVFADFDGDSYPDLYVAVNGSSDEFYWNNAGQFVNATLDVGLTHAALDMGVAVADFDDDDDLDLYVSNITDPNGFFGRGRPYNSLHVHGQDGGGATVFTDEALGRGVEDSSWGWGVQFADAENDGDLDLVAVSGFDEWALALEGPSCAVCDTPTYLYINDGTGHYTRSETLDTPDSRALIAFDYDRDGDQDFLITNINEPVQLMENVSPEVGNWLTVVPRPHQPAVGTRVYATVGGVTKRRDIVAGQSYLSGTPAEAHFGLGDATQVDDLRVVWPDGSEEDFGTVPANQVLTIFDSPQNQNSHLTLVKQVTTDDGGTAATTDWLLSASGPTPISGFGGVDSDVAAGTYSLSESGGPSGYTASAWLCVGGSQNGNQITLSDAESATCTITNDDVRHSIARQWNDETLDAIRKDFARPTVHARNLYHTSVAMWDAWAAYDQTAGQVLHRERADAIDIEAARAETMSFAAYWLLRWRFASSPGAALSLQSFDDRMDEMGYDRFFMSTAGNTPAALGNRIAQTIFVHGLTDHANELGEYGNFYYEPVNPPLLPDFPGNPDLVDPNRWQPLALEFFIDQGGNPVPGGFPDFLSPEWGQVKPFSLSTDDLTILNRDGFDYWVYHDPGPPPPLSSAEYKSGFEQVVEWSSLLDPTDGVMIDISPASRGDNPLGSNDGDGHDVNPHTGLPYEPNVVPAGDYYRVLAEFWADGPESETPPGHWFTIANYVSDHPLVEKRLGGVGAQLGDLEWDVKAYLALGGAMHDVAIAAWGVKGWYDYIRPVSAIRHMCDNGPSSDPSDGGINLHPGYIELVTAATTAPGGIHEHLAGVGGENIGKVAVHAWRGPDDIVDPATDTAGVGWILCENWWPYQRPSFVTPPFAGYVSGHSTFSRAAAEVMTLLTGDSFFPGGMGTFEAPKNEFLVFEDGPTVDITLQWATYADASDETSLSRIYGGIHPTADDIPGRLMGAVIGPDAYHHAERYFSGELGVVPPLSAHLTLIKQVTNDDGGIASATDWLLSASGPTPISGAGGVDSDVAPGTYELSELWGPDGYTASAWACVGGSRNGDEITLADGESATCTITNDDNPAPVQLPFIDVTQAAQLEFTVEYGDEFASLTHPDPVREQRLQMLLRNLGNGAAVGDFDNDGDLDVYLLGQLGRSNRLYRNDLETGNKTFTDVTVAPLDDLGMSRLAHFADLDNDGFLDLVLVNDDEGSGDYPASKLFRNDGGTGFTDVTPGSGFEPFGYPHLGASLADFDGDGLLDIYLTVWNNGIFPGTNQLFRNLGDFRFEEVTAASGLAGLDRRSMTPVFADFDGDSYPDLYVAVDGSSDEFYWNNAGQFVNATLDVGLTHAALDMGVAVADFDDDDDLDLYVSNITDPNGFFGRGRPYNSLHVHGQDGGGATVFTDEALGRGVEDSSWGWGVQFADAENDGDLDLVAVSGFDEWALALEGPSCAVCDTPTYLYINDGTGHYTRSETLDTPDSRALIAFDYDRDGDQDFLITNINEPVQLMENVSPEVGNWLTVVPRPHQPAVGTRVYATVGGVTKRRDIVAGQSYLSGTPAEAHFGLGDATQVDDLRVVWPDGSEEDFGTVPANQVLTIFDSPQNQNSHLTLVKQVTTDDGGTAATTDWLLSASGPTPISGFGGVDSDVAAGTYSLSESGGPSGYTASAWLCVGGSQNGNQITLGDAESATCTITNDDDPEPVQLNFVEVSAESGIEADYYTGTTRHNLGVNWLDFDADGWPDLFVTNGFGRSPHLFRNVGGSFVKVDQLLPALPGVELAGSVFGDYDNDGDVDLFIQTTNEQWNTWGFNFPDGPADILLKNLWVENGEQIIDGEPLFVDVAAAAGVQGMTDPPFGTYPARRSMTGGWLDVDRDGCLDLYVGRLVHSQAGEIPNLDTLYRNRCDGSGVFDDQTTQRGLYNPADPGTLRPTLAFFGGHLDGDTWPDIYVVNSSPDVGIGHDHRDLFFLNDGAGSFVDGVPLSPGLGDDSGVGMGIDVADIDLDGDWDIYITDLQLGIDEPPETNVLYLGNGDGTWEDNSAQQAGVQGSSLWSGNQRWGANSWSANFFDADQDGYEDLLVGFWEQTVLFMNDGAGAFTPVVVDSGSFNRSRGAATADYDRDGDLDFAIVHWDGGLELHRNDSSNLGNWIELKLEGAGSNRSAIGALIEVRAGDLSMMRQVKGGSSSHSQDDLIVHFGLGREQVVDELSIHWPSGAVEHMESVPANQFLSCTESGGDACSLWTP